MTVMNKLLSVCDALRLGGMAKETGLEIGGWSHMGPNHEDDWPLGGELLLMFIEILYCTTKYVCVV